MPQHRGVHIALVSQYDAMFIPEYRSPEDGEGQKREADTHAVDAYISNYAASQFWIRYACDMSTQDLETRFFYFKLYVAGIFSVAWGCGAQDEWEGQTLFVPNDVSREKLGLFFPRNVDATAEMPAFEVLVYRAKARRRQERQYASTATAQQREDVVQYAGCQCSTHL